VLSVIEIPFYFACRLVRATVEKFKIIGDFFLENSPNFDFIIYIADLKIFMI